MQAIILSAGKSTRTYPLTITKPKPLLKVANKPIIIYALESLVGIVEEIIVIVGYKKESIISYLGDTFKGMKIRYVTQKSQTGTGSALALAKQYLKDRFLVMMGDDIYSKKDIIKCKKYSYAVVGCKVKELSNFGVYVIENGFVKDLIEKPKTFVSEIANTGLYLLDTKIFGLLEEIKKSERNEYELTSAIRLLANELEVRCITTTKWYPIGYPWDLLRVDKILRNKKKIIGKNTKIKGSVINSSIGDNCFIEGKILNSIIMDNTIIKDSFIEDSVIGSNVNFQGTIISKSGIIKNVNGKDIKVERLGAVIGDNVQASNVNVINGAMIWPNETICNCMIDKDVY